MTNQIQNPNVKMFSKTISYLSVTTLVVRFTVQGCFSFHQLTLNPWPRPGFPLPLRKNSWSRVKCDRFKNAYQVAPGQAWTIEL